MSNNHTTKEKLLTEMISDAQVELSRIRERETFLTGFLAELTGRLSPSPNGPLGSKRAIRQAKSGVRITGDSLTSEVLKVLGDQGRRMRGTEIASLLEQAGGGGNRSPKRLVASVLSTLRKRKDLFAKVARGTYALKKAVKEGVG